MKTIAFVPTADAAAVPPGLHAEVPVVQVTGLHGLLIDRPLTRPRLVAFLDQGVTEPHANWNYAAIQRGRDYKADVCPPP